MKSKKIIVGLVLLNFIVISPFISNATSNNPIQANVYSLGFDADDEFEFFCTVFNTTELFNVFGGNWQSDIGSYLWFTGNLPPTDLGEKAKFLIANITDQTTMWIFTIDGWSWIDESASYGAPALNDGMYLLPKNASGGMWNPTVWIISLPVVQFLMELTYSGGFTIDGNKIIYADTDVDDFIMNWIYDEKTGVVKTFKIKKADDTVIFEVKSPSVSSKDEIPGYSLYILISTIFLLISFISIVLIKKIKWT